jgi:hypothetical protein
LGDAGPLRVEDAAGYGEMGYRVSVQNEITVVEADEECDERDEDASYEDGVGFARDHRADGFGIARNPDGCLAEGAGATALLAEDEGAGLDVG